MSLAPGTRLGPYEIAAQVGVGGMGEVYRATDTNLKRQVAIKVLPASVAADAERLARFQREAEVLAALNHPNIAAIYGLEKADGVIALVMELVEGEDLSQRIARGAIPVDEALPIAKQIAEALEAAHEQGIIHRDLKPANIKVRPDGTVKVLDFGLAKAMEPVGAMPPGMSQAPTITTPAMTQAGMILGTAAYMSPEQASGKPVDRRSDLWAFGVVLYEMLTGRRLFDGETVSHVLAAVLTKDPDWTALPPHTPAPVRRLLRRCLERDRRKRVSDATDARLDIDDALAPPAMESVARPARRVAVLPTVMALAGGVLVTVLVLWVWTRWTPTPAPQSMRFSIVSPATQPLWIQGSDRDIALSPDGSRLVYVTEMSRAQGGRLVVRAIDQLDAVPLAGITNARNPFVSPDGRWVGFFTNFAVSSDLRKVPVTGGPPLVLGRYEGNPRGASWGPDGTIVFATDHPGTGLLTVPEGGGNPKVLTKPDTEQGELDHVFPSVLPGGRAVLFTIAASPIENSQVAVLDLETGQRKTVIRGGTHAEYVEPGYLVYALAGTLWAARFDPTRLEVMSDPVAVIEQVATMDTGAGEFAVSRDGVLVYIPGGIATRFDPLRSLVWVNRQGREEPSKAPPRAYAIPRLSPDGTRIALDIRDQDVDIWIWDIARQTLQRLTKDPNADLSPVWMPDGRRIAWGSAAVDERPNLYWQAADGTGVPERLSTGSSPQFPTSVSADGKRLVLFEGPSTATADVSVLSLGGRAPSPVEPLLHTPAGELGAEISPDGHWLAYQSNESGQFEVYVRPFPNVNDRRLLVSTSGGTRPVWARNGRELFYLDAKDLLTAVSVQTSATDFKAGVPVRILETAYYAGTSTRGIDLRGYDVSSDGQRFLMIKENASPDQTSAGVLSMVVVLNWQEELNRLVPTR